MARPGWSGGRNLARARAPSARGASALPHSLHRLAPRRATPLPGPEARACALPAGRKRKHGGAQADNDNYPWPAGTFPPAEGMD